MQFSEKMMDHFTNPRNVGSLDEESSDVGVATITSDSCGDVTKLYIQVADGVITDVKFKTFGCGAAIASSSYATEWLKGKSLTEAVHIKDADIAEVLELPVPKVHCSVMSEDAISAAIDNWKQKNGQG